MPAYIITAPDGKEYDVDAPEGATEQDALSYIQKQFNPSSPANIAVSPSNAGAISGGAKNTISQELSMDELMNPMQQQTPSLGQEIIRPVARAARAGLSGIAGIGDMAGAAIPLIRQGMRSGLEAAGVDFMGVNTPYVPPSQGVKNIFDAATGGIAQPRSDLERIGDVAGEVMAGGGAMKGAQTLAKGGGALLSKLAPQSAAELSSLGGAGAGMEIGRQIDPESPIAPLIGAVIGGAATVKALESIRKSGDVGALDAAYFNRKANINPEGNGVYFQKQATKILEKNLDTSKAQSLRSQLEADKNLVLPDIGGDEVRALTRQVGKFKGGARNEVDKFFTDRDRNAGRRISNVINSKVSGVDKYYGSLDEMNSSRSELAKTQYDDAFNTHKQMKLTPSLNKFVQDGRFLGALNEARTKKLINIEEPINSLRTMDSVYRTLRDKASIAFNAGAKEEGAVYSEFAKDFVKRLDAEAPKYKEARNTFAGFSNMIEAQELGKNYTKFTPEQIQNEFKSFTKGEQDAFKIGVKESLQNEVLKTSRSADEATKIFGKAMQRQQLKPILGDQFGEFSQRMRKEIRMADTKFRVTGGSRTDFNTIEDGQFIESAARAVRGGKVQLTNEILNTVADAVRNKYMGINPNNAKILAKVLTNNKASIKALDDLIAKQTNPNEKALLNAVKKDYNYLLVPTTSQYINRIEQN